ncbi:hypothetical protein AX14_002297 [Amanita brunnescens Koide BX004]|nr:hypothetical protein AX14_002297 [Amanita brunnescens Koide BX004]
MAVRLLLFAALFSWAAAYSGTYPIVAWSSQPSNALQALPASFEGPNSLLAHIISNSAVCDHVAIIIIEHPGVHASDLRSLPFTSGLARRLASNRHVRHYPYVPFDSHLEVSTHADVLSQQCDCRLITFNPGEAVTFDLGHKHVIHLTLPPFSISNEPRENVIKYHEDILSTELDSLMSIFPEHLVIYTGAPLSSELMKRQTPDVTARPVLELTDSLAPSNTTLPSGGILKRYQLLTPALISTLLIVLFVLLPIIILGITALASIQSPLRVEASKSYSAREKKIQ